MAAGEYVDVVMAVFGQYAPLAAGFLAVSLGLRFVGFVIGQFKGAGRLG